MSQYTSALEAIQEQPKHQPYRSSDTPAIAPFRADLQFFLGSHPELTPRYAEGVILMQQAANPGLDTACPLRSDQLTFRHGDQCAKQQHARVASQQFPESCGMLRPASMRHAVDPVSKSLCSREQQLLHVSESSCLPARLASFGYSHR